MSSHGNSLTTFQKTSQDLQRSTQWLSSLKSIERCRCLWQTRTAPGKHYKDVCGLHAKLGNWLFISIESCTEIIKNYDFAIFHFYLQLLIKLCVVIELHLEDEPTVLALANQLIKTPVDRNASRRMNIFFIPSSFTFVTGNAVHR